MATIHGTLAIAGVHQGSQRTGDYTSGTSKSRGWWGERRGSAGGAPRHAVDEREASLPLRRRRVRVRRQQRVAADAVRALAAAGQARPRRVRQVAAGLPGADTAANAGLHSTHQLTHWLTRRRCSACQAATRHKSSGRCGAGHQSILPGRGAALRAGRRHPADCGTSAEPAIWAPCSAGENTFVGCQHP